MCLQTRGLEGAFVQVRVLGAHNLETAGTRHSCFLLDGALALDAGSLVSALTPEEHQRIEAILLTHRHLDHTRDLPSLGLSTLNESGSIHVSGLSETLQAVRDHLLNDVMYPDFTHGLNSQAPKFQFRDIEPESWFGALTYDVKAIEVPHTAPAVGYLVRSRSDICAGFSGDLGGQLGRFFAGERAPDVMFVECTFPDRLEDLARLTGHLTPSILRHELEGIRRAGHELPQIVLVHMSFTDHAELSEQAMKMGKGLNAEVRPAFAGMVIDF